MLPDDDLDLLRAYAENRSEVAYSELVRRHLNLVYSAALRIVGNDAHLAEDVAQIVFCDLARRVKVSKSALREVRSLPGWLYQYACFTASKVVRGEQRRHVRERKASAMNEPRDPSTPHAEWNRLRPVLDGAMMQLGEQDREAVVLRYFEGQKLGEIGSRLGLSENAARMRIDRALGRLRDILKRRGVTSTVSGLGAILAQQGIVAAPGGMVASITIASLSSATATTLCATSTLEILMASMKVKMGLAALVAASVTAPIVLQHQQISGLAGELAALQQQGSESDQLRTEVDRLIADARLMENQRAKEQAELMRLRGELSALKARAPKTPGVAQDSASAGHPADITKPAIGTVVRAEEWKNVGFQFPSSTVQTLEWAKVNGDTNLIFNAIAWGDEQSRAGMESIFAAAPESVRERYGSADAYVASLFNHSGPMDDRHTLTSYRILDEKIIGEEAILTLEYHYADGSTPSGPRRYVRIGDEWRQAMDFDEPSVGKIRTQLQTEDATLAQPP
jgi:RNA polymerase sigma factor (sigma-70 family)